MNAVSIQNLSVAIHGAPILKEVTAAFPNESVIGLLGPSGSGKTTLMRTIVGLQKPATGSVSVLGFPAGTPALRSDVGYMAQSPSVYGDLTVQQNLDYFGRIVGVSKSRIAELLQEVDLETLAGRLVGTLSGGQRARVSLATAMLARPKLLVLDEPTVGLDPLLRETLWQKFRELAGQGSTLIISSHVMDEASRCDTLLLLREGRVIGSGAPADLIKRTKTKSVNDAFIKLVQEVPA